MSRQRPSVRRRPLFLLVIALLIAGCSDTDEPFTLPSSEAPVEAATPSTPSTPSTTGSAASASSTAQPSTTEPEREEATPPGGLEPLILGHNDPSADRINLIFAPWGWDDHDDFRTVAELFLGWDQRAQLIDIDGRIAGADRDAISAQLGLFGFEPFRSNADKFNVWITEISPPGPALWLNTEDVPFDLPDQSIVTLALDPDREVPGITSVAGQDLAFGLQEVPMRTGADSVANAMVLISSSYPAATMLDLPHELGHALFGFADEYVGRAGVEDPDIPPRPDIWPSCAAGRDTAERWWGDLVGEYDPMIDVWAEEMTAVGFGDLVGDLDLLRDLVRTDYVEDGCFGDPGSIRSAEDTLMGFSQPAFGLTNRRAAERILELWAG